MNERAVIAGGIAAVMLAAFAVFESMAVAAPAVAGVAGVALLAADVVLPVPSSLVMTMQGSVYGWAVGAALSTVGSMLMAVVAFAIGRAGRANLPPQAGRAWLISLTRPVPILAETAAIMAGTTQMGWPRFLLSAALGVIPMALVYAIAGALATTGSFILVFSAVMLSSGALWFWARSRPAPAT